MILVLIGEAIRDVLNGSCRVVDVNVYFTRCEYRWNGLHIEESEPSLCDRRSNTIIAAIKPESAP